MSVFVVRPKEVQESIEKAKVKDRIEVARKRVYLFGNIKNPPINRQKTGSSGGCLFCGKYYFGDRKRSHRLGFCTKRCRKLSGSQPVLKKVHPLVGKAEFYETREWRELRYKALLIHGRKCLCCFATGVELHVDHIKPISKFPDLALKIDNLQVLCRQCNLGKSNKDQTDFRVNLNG